MKPATHIQKRRTEGIDNKRFILQMTGVSDAEYFWLFIDTGRAFLRELFPDDETYNEFYELHRNNPLFWKWFRVEWLSEEQSYVKFLQDNEVVQDATDWKANMLQMVVADTTLKSFDLYIKILTK